MVSFLQKERLSYKPAFPELLRDLHSVSFVPTNRKKAVDEELKSLFPKTFDQPVYGLQKSKAKAKPLKVGVVFSGGQASGGHNVIAALFDTGVHLIGFLNGPGAIVENRFVEIRNVDAYRNQGGFDLLGSGRTKIETEEQLAASLKTVLSHRLDGLVIIGGDDSNTNAAILAEYFLKNGCQTRVVGIPKTIDGDLRSEDIEISFGFDSATKTYAETIGNIARDALSAKKYYHFIRLMGRSASHVALECAFLTQPNLVLIAEEKHSIEAIVAQIADLVMDRYAAGKEYGVILLPEGLAEAMPEQMKGQEKDPHGNLQISQIDTEKFLAHLVQKELQKRQFKGKFNPLTHFLGYEGRACMPTNFDANYCYTLGLCASLAIRDGLTGVICAVQNLEKNIVEWTIKAVPIIHLMQMETRLGKRKPVIKKFLVNTQGKAFAEYLRLKKKWSMDDVYLYPGPIQFFGKAEITDSAPYILKWKDHASN